MRIKALQMREEGSCLRFLWFLLLPLLSPPPLSLNCFADRSRENVGNFIKGDISPTFSEHEGDLLLPWFKLEICLRALSQFSSVQSLSRVRLFCDPMNHWTPGLPVHHQLPQFTQTHVHQVDDAIQPSHPLSSPSPPAPNPSQHQSLFQWVNSSHEVSKVLEFQL